MRRRLQKTNTQARVQREQGWTCQRLRATSATSLPTACGSSMRSTRPARSVRTRTHTGGASGRPRSSSTKLDDTGALRASSAAFLAVRRCFRLLVSSFRATATLAMPYRSASSVACDHRSSGMRELRGRVLRHCASAAAISASCGAVAGKHGDLGRPLERSLWAYQGTRPAQGFHAALPKEHTRTHLLKAISCSIALSTGRVSARYGPQYGSIKLSSGLDLSKMRDTRTKSAGVTGICSSAVGGRSRESRVRQLGVSEIGRF